MVWKKGKKPEQYLFTITDEFSDNWKSFKEEAKCSNQNISELLRNTVSSKLKNNTAKKALVLSPHTDDAELGCGGTIAKLIEEGWKVHVIYFSEKFFRSVVKMRGIQLSSPFAEGFETIKVRLDQLL